MKVIDKMAENIRQGIRSFLKIEPAQKNMITIQEVLDYVSNAAVNRIWYRGDSEELSQLYKSFISTTSRFWAAVPSAYLDIRKIHTGIPGIIVDTLTSLIIADMNGVQLEDNQELWDKISEDNDFSELMKQAITDTLVIGDGVFRISFDPEISEYPLLEFVPGDQVEYVYRKNRIREVIVKTQFNYKQSVYTLVETYGYGYLNTALYKDNNEVELHSTPNTMGLASEITFDKSFMLCVPFKIFSSAKFKGRGKSIFDGKTENFDSLDEVWSQWMDAVRKGRSKEYIPSDILPRNPVNGELLKPNPFDNAYIENDSSMAEGANSKIELIQPVIPHESYLASYITALDLCLQGIISPSTLGIDTKKLENAEAQREKEKTTLYTRNKIIEALQNSIPKLVDVVLKAQATYNKQPLISVKADFPFGEYANPSFESQVETLGKARQSGIMSTEAIVDELYGDTKDSEWKAEEIQRIKSEQGIMQTEEPSINRAIGDMQIDEV